MKKNKNKCILELASSEEDIAVLNTKLVDFMLPPKKVDPIAVDNMTANILLLCRNSAGTSLDIASLSLATALFIIYNKSSPICMREYVPITSKVN